MTSPLLVHAPFLLFWKATILVAVKRAREMHLARQPAGRPAGVTRAPMGRTVRVLVLVSVLPSILTNPLIFPRTPWAPVGASIVEVVGVVGALLVAVAGEPDALLALLSNLLMASLVPFQWCLPQVALGPLDFSARPWDTADVGRWLAILIAETGFWFVFWAWNDCVNDEYCRRATLPEAGAGIDGDFVFVEHTILSRHATPGDS